MQSSWGVSLPKNAGLVAINGPARIGTRPPPFIPSLQQLASPERKVLTAEDPIETRIPYVSHTQVSPKTNFSTLARSFMRQDSEVIFIGEVRDEESAAATVQLAQTGHLVLTTMHTRDAVGVISRLEAFEVHSNFIANSLIGSLAQRLIPTLCTACRVAYQPDAETLEAFGADRNQCRCANLLQEWPWLSRNVPSASQVGWRSSRRAFVSGSPELADTDPIALAPGRKSSRSPGRRECRTLIEDILDCVYAFGHTDIQAVKGYLFSPSYFQCRRVA